MNYQIVPATNEEILELVDKLHVPDFDYNLLGNESVDTKEALDEKIEEKEVHANIVKFDIGVESLTYLMWRCDPKYRNRLFAGGKEFLAKNITWKYGRIAWRAGGGWPLYEIPCPPKRGLPTHRLKGIFGGKAFDPCSTPYTGQGQHMTGVYWQVADDKYDDNTGYFELIITAYSKE